MAREEADERTETDPGTASHPPTPTPGSLRFADIPASPPAPGETPPRPRGAIGVALVVLASVAAATLVTRALWPWIAPSIALILASVVFCAWYGGLAAGVAAAVLGTAASEVFVVGVPSDAPETGRALTRAAVFAGCAVLVSRLSMRRRVAEFEMRIANQDLEDRVAERTRRLRQAVDSLGVEVERRARAEHEAIATQERLRAMAAEVAGAEERERRRVASGLHDEVAQLLSVALSRVRSIASSPLGVAHDEDCRAALDALSKALATVRTLTFEIAPPVLYELGLRVAASWLVSRARQADGVDVAFSYAGTEARAQEPVEVAVFQSLRELLRNATRHAQAKQVRVELEVAPPRLALVVSDDGVGFDPVDRKRAATGWGLFSIEERLRHVGGRLSIDSAPGAGTRVTIEVPIPAMRDDAEAAR